RSKLPQSGVRCPELWKFRRIFQCEVMNEVHYRSPSRDSYYGIRDSTAPTPQDFTRRYITNSF
ncbi:MAG: hypothetical protein KAJ51_03930, partial [Thermoplasmata archaeon]|nr:hypothetical protein [Thermoplasmata archaeon]